MNILEFFRSPKRASAATAKERLQIVLAHERSDRSSPDFLPRLQKDLLEVIKRYVPIDEEKLAVKLQRENGCSLLEVNVELPIHPAAAARQHAGARG